MQVIAGAGSGNTYCHDTPVDTHKEKIIKGVFDFKKKF